jgi:hypothetical protein
MAMTGLMKTPRQNWGYKMVVEEEKAAVVLRRNFVPWAPTLLAQIDRVQSRHFNRNKEEWSKCRRGKKELMLLLCRLHALPLMMLLLLLS